MLLKAAAPLFEVRPPEAAKSTNKMRASTQPGEVVVEAGPLAIVVIDTLNRVMPGGDENSSEDMGAVIAAAKLIEREFDCVVLFVHHSGKDEAKGSRGHSSLKGATDAEIDDYVSAVDAALSEMTTAATNLGSAKERVGIQKDFVATLMSAIERGVSTLVDADMNSESTKLQALQVQQQLGIQALSIANSSSQNILALFRNG